MNSHKWIWIIALIFFAKACFLAFWVTPLWDIPDETRHFAYARNIFSGKGIPILGKSLIDSDIIIDLYGEAIDINLLDKAAKLNTAAQHPPAYYMLAGAIWKLATFVTDDQGLLFRATRIMSAIGGALTLVVLYHLLLLVSGSPLTSLAFASCVGCIPMFSNLASGTNHDTTVVLFVALATYFWAKYVLRSKAIHDAYFAALWLSIACFTKLTALVLTAPMLAILMYEFDSPWRQRIRQSLSLVAVWLVLPTLWMLRSYVHYQMLLPTVHDGFVPFFREDNPLTDSLVQYLSSQPAIESFFSHFFGLFGWIGTGKGRSVILSSITSWELMYYSIIAFLLTSLAGVYISYVFLNHRCTPDKSQSLACLVGELSAPFSTRKAFGGTAILLGLMLGFCTSHLIFVRHTPGYQCRSIFYGLLSFLAVLGCFALLRKSLSKERIVAYAWIITLFFIVVVIRQVYKMYLLDGQLRALHGRYFYPLIPLMMIGVVIPAISLLKRYAGHFFVALALALAYLELHIYLSQVIPFFARGGA